MELYQKTNIKQLLHPATECKEQLFSFRKYIKDEIPLASLATEVDLLIEDFGAWSEIGFKNYRNC